MKLSYAPLITLEITHDYYDDGRCRDFELFIPSRSQRELERHRLIARHNDGVLTILKPAEVDLDKHARLHIGLKLRNAFFGNITASDDLPSTSSPSRASLLWAWDANTPALSGPDVVTFVSRRHTIAQLGGMARPIEVKLLDASTSPMRLVKDFHIPDGDTRDTLTIELTGAPPADRHLLPVGPYALSWGNPGTGVAQREALYLEPELAAQSVFGVVEVPFDGLNAEINLTVAFEAPTQLLRYLIVGRNYSAADLEQLTLEDEGIALDGGRDPINFTQVPQDNPEFTTVRQQHAARFGDGVGLALFKSDAPLRRKARAYRGLALHKNGSLLVKHLPMPSAESATDMVIVHLTKPQPGAV